METQTKEAQQQASAPVNGTQAITTPDKPTDQALAPVGGPTVITWTRERVDLIKRQICPAGITDDEFSIFIEQCKRTALDPLIGEAFCVPRSTKITKPNPDPRARWPLEEYVTKHVFQPAESGMASRADRFPDFRGIKGAAVHENDTIEIDAEAGTVVHKFNPISAKRGKLVGAWARVFRENRHTPIEWLTLAEYQQTKKDGGLIGQWSGKPETMITKCARAAAYRRAYPNVFGGLYIEEEMPEERELNTAPGGTAPSGDQDTRTKAQRMADDVKAKSGTTPAAAPQSAKTSTVDAQATASAPAASSPAPAQAPVARFGKESVKGQPLSKLSDAQLAELATLGRDSIQKSPAASWAPVVEANLQEIEAERTERAIILEEEAKAAAATVPADAPTEAPAP